MSLTDTKTGYRYFSAFGRRFRRDANGDIQVQVFERPRGFGTLGELGSWWQDLIGAGVGAGMSIYATQMQGQVGQQGQAQQVLAAFWQLYNYTFPTIDQIMRGLEAGQVPAAQVPQVAAAAEQIWAQWQSTTAQMSAAVSSSFEGSPGVTLHGFIQECNAALTVKLNRIRAVAQQNPAQLAATPTNTTGQVGVQQVGVDSGTGFFDQSVLGIPIWAIAIGAVLLLKRK